MKSILKMTRVVFLILLLLLVGCSAEITEEKTIEGEEVVGLADESLFETKPRGTAWDHFVVQATQVLAAGQREGGFFVMMGKKPGPPFTLDSNA